MVEPTVLQPVPPSRVDAGYRRIRRPRRGRVERRPLYVRGYPFPGAASHGRRHSWPRTAGWERLPRLSARGSPLTWYFRMPARHGRQSPKSRPYPYRWRCYLGRSPWCLDKSAVGGRVASPASCRLRRTRLGISRTARCRAGTGPRWRRERAEERRRGSRPGSGTKFRAVLLRRARQRRRGCAAGRCARCGAGRGIAGRGRQPRPRVAALARARQRRLSRYLAPETKSQG